jgi:L-threonylcarbamoyladenylate synthase
MGLVTKGEAVKLLKKGTPVALPTETVYGLAAPIDQPDCLHKVFEIKKRPFNDPLIVHAADSKMALNLFEKSSSQMIRLAEKFWPGPLTLVSRKNTALVCDLITSGMPTVAVRVPQSDVFREVIKGVGSPLAAPSANLFKKVSPTTAQHVLDSLPEVSVLDGGRSEIGIESTIFDVDHLKVLRPGGVTIRELEEVLGKKVQLSEQKHVPGSETDHYQPHNPVHVFESAEDLKAFMGSESAVELKLGQDPKVAAHNFYALLRELDGKAQHICVFYNPNFSDDSWLGLKNRLLKASTKWNSSDKDS